MQTHLFPSYRLCPGANYVDNKESCRPIECPVCHGVHQKVNNTAGESLQGMHVTKSPELEWDVEGKGLRVMLLMERKRVSQLNTARHLKQPIDLLFRVHAGRLLVIKHSAAKINKRCGALNLAASKSYLKTTKKHHFYSNVTRASAWFRPSSAISKIKVCFLFFQAGVQLESGRNWIQLPDRESIF